MGSWFLNNTMKKILIIFVVILILGLLGWFFLIQKDGGEQSGGGQENVGFFGGLFSDDSVLGLDEERPPLAFENEGGFGFGFDDNLVLARRQFGESVLQQLTTASVAGFIATTTSDRVSSVRFVERITGNIYQVDPEQTEAVRITNTTIPGVYEAIWNKDATRVVLRYLDENDVIKTFNAHIVSGMSVSTLDGRFLPDDIDFFTADDDGENIFYTIRGDRETLLKKSSFNGSGVETIYRSFLHELLYEITNSGKIFFTTKASGLVTGLVYSLEERGGAVPEKILDSILGLTVNTSPRGDRLLLSQSTSVGFGLFLLELKTRDMRLFPVKTLPEKCVWSPIKRDIVYCGVPNLIIKDLYPDSWYQGKISFSDSIWKIDVSTDTTRLLVDLRNESDFAIDVINPSISELGEYLFFTNKKDSSLWSLHLSE